MIILYTWKFLNHQFAFNFVFAQCSVAQPMAVRPHATFDNNCRDEICGRPHVHLKYKIWQPCWRIMKKNKRKARKSVDTMRNDLDGDATKSYRMNTQFMFECVSCWLALGSSGVFRGNRARHLPLAPFYAPPPWGVTRVHFPYFWRNFIIHSYNALQNRS